MCEALKDPLNRQFRRRCQMAAAFCVIVYIVASQASIRMHGTTAGLVLAGLAGIAFFSELVSVGLLVTRIRDEFQRVLLTRSFVWATLITMAFVTVWGFMELHARSRVPHLDFIWIPIILVCVMAAAKVFIFRQYRPENE